jgi:Lrp/AsnC family leucine-responsive transcriptional regulator
MDSIDRRLIIRLQFAGRETWAKLGKTLGLTGPAVAERVRRLQQRGILRGFAALVNPESVGMSVTAFVGVSLERAALREPFLKRVAFIPEVQECHHVTGDDEFLLKLRCRNPLDLDRVVSEELKGTPGVVRARTTVVLRTTKETTVVPLPPDNAA